MLTTSIDAQYRVLFEQPLTEHMRVCLRLEDLFQQLDLNLNLPIVTNSELALTAIVKILEVIQRPDLKSKLTQLMAQQVSTLSQLKQIPQVDTHKLKQVIQQLDQMIDHLHQQRKRLAEPLYENELLKQVRVQMHNPGGICHFSCPAHSLWLTLPHQQRIDDLKSWTAHLDELRRIVRLVLMLTREGNIPTRVECADGFYTQALDTNLSCELVRISLSRDLRIYPEFNFGRSRLNVRFIKLPIMVHERPQQYQEPFDLELTCCYL